MALGLNFSSQSSQSSSTPVVIPQSPQEAKAAGLNLQLLQAQLDQITKQTALQDQIFSQVIPQVLGVLGSSDSTLSSQTDRNQQQAQALQRNKLQADVISRLQNEQFVSEADRVLLDKLANEQFGAGLTQIRNSTTENLGLLRDELAPALGLRRTDSPILDRGGQIAAAGVEQEGQLTSAVNAARASNELGLRQSGEQGLLQQLGQLDQASQFRSNLRSQNFTNSLALLGQTGQTGINLAGVTSGAGIQQALKPIVAQETKTKSSGGGSGFSIG